MSMICSYVYGIWYVYTIWYVYCTSTGYDVSTRYDMYVYCTSGTRRPGAHRPPSLLASSRPFRQNGSTLQDGHLIIKCRVIFAKSDRCLKMPFHVRRGLVRTPAGQLVSRGAGVAHLYIYQINKSVIRHKKFFFILTSCFQMCKMPK